LLIFVGWTSADGNEKSQYLENVFGAGKELYRIHNAAIPNPTSLPNIITASHTTCQPPLPSTGREIYMA
jgi:hypothetical protein